MKMSNSVSMACMAAVISIYVLTGTAADKDQKLWTDIVLELRDKVSRQGFVHPGLLSTRADLKLMREKVAAGEEPWKGSWDILVRNTDAIMKASPEVEETIRTGGRVRENYMRLGRDAARVYQLALRHHGSGDPRFADKAVEILNAWAAGHKGWEGDSNLALRGGIYGYQFACAAELLRDYTGWRRSDFKKFQNYMLEQFYPGNKNFMLHRFGTPPHHYWSNWTQANQASLMAIGVLCDNWEIFEEGLKYFFEGNGTENVYHAINFIHPCGLGQWQESGRDQGHTLMGPQLTGVVCEIAWNQGIDLYGYANNRFLASVEYISKYNLGHDVPYVKYVRVFRGPWGPQDHVMEHISPGGRGQIRAGWDLVYNHYVNRMGLAAPYTAKYAALARPEGGGFNYGGTSGGFDGLGFTTLTHSREPVAKGAMPSGLRTTVLGRQVTLAWWGSAYAMSYNVKRATADGGPYTTIATVTAGGTLFFVDAGLIPGTTYYYVVSANNPDGESADSEPASATPMTSITLQAEFATFGNGAKFSSFKHPGFHGMGFLELPGDAYVEFKNIDGGAGGSATLDIRYALGNTALAALLIVNDDSRDLITLAETGAWENYATQSFPVKLNSGKGNTVRIQSIGEPWNVDEITVTPAVPASVPHAPENLKAASGAPGEIALSWTAVQNADSYTIKRAANSGGPYVIIDNVVLTNYTDSGLPAGSHYYVVSALKTVGESANSQESLAHALVNFSPKVLCSEPEANSPEGAANAFDGNVRTKWFTGVGHATATLQADFGEGRELAVVRYDITSANDIPARDPKVWEFQASNDGEKWTTLEVRRDEVFSERFHTNRYPINNRTAYRYYRLNILANSGDDESHGLQLAELVLLGEQDPIEDK